MMKITALNETERVALMGLLKLIIQADEKMSSEEVAELNKMAAEMGTAKWEAAKAAAMTRFKDKNAIREFLESSVERAAARELLLSLARQMAGADDTDQMEESVIRWLIRIWNIRQ